MDATTIAVDLAKDVFEVALVNRMDRIVGHKRFSRLQFERFLDGLPAGTLVLMEACGTAHYWGQRCLTRGLQARLLPPQYVRPYVRRNKTDRTDTEALVEANRCGTLKPVPIKTREQQTLQALHRVRTQWMTTRTARLNVMRAVLREHGVAIGVGAQTALRRIPALLEDATGGLPGTVCTLVAALLEEVRTLEARIGDLDRQLTRIARAHPVAQRLQQVPGIGVITSTALVGSVGHIQAFRRGRQFASWLGLTPRESSTGQRRYLGTITKRGDVYLRCLLCHGARAVLHAACRTRRTTPQAATGWHQWAAKLVARCGPQKATVAVANKLARWVWAVWHHDRDFVMPVGVAT